MQLTSTSMIASKLDLHCCAARPIMSMAKTMRGIFSLFSILVCLTLSTAVASEVDVRKITPEELLEIPNEAFIPTYVPKPRYPNRAQGKPGYATISFTITETGAVEYLVVIEEKPKRRGFGKSALKAGSKLTYNPIEVNGFAVKVPGARYRFGYGF